MITFDLFYEAFNASDMDVNQAYEVFQKEYLKSTGQAWSKEKFLQRASRWEFYGDVNGYIAVRRQKSGFVKLVGMAGSDKSKYKGFKELMAQRLPVWGMVDDKISALLQKMGFRGPNMIELFLFKKMMTPEKMKYILGGATINNVEGNKVTLTYPDIGTVTKYFMATPEYWKKLRGNVI